MANTPEANYEASRRNPPSGFHDSVPASALLGPYPPLANAIAFDIQVHSEVSAHRVALMQDLLIGGPFKSWFRCRAPYDPTKLLDPFYSPLMGTSRLQICEALRSEYPPFLMFLGALGYATSTRECYYRFLREWPKSALSGTVHGCLGMLACMELAGRVYEAVYVRAGVAVQGLRNFTLTAGSLWDLYCAANEGKIEEPDFEEDFKRLIGKPYNYQWEGANQLLTTQTHKHFAIAFSDALSEDALQRAWSSAQQLADQLKDCKCPRELDRWYSSHF